MAPKAAPVTSSKATKGASVEMPKTSGALAADSDDDDAPTPGSTPALTKPEEGAAPMTPKNFRNHPDMENFFRFIYENDLRLEALEIIDQIIVTRQARKAGTAMKRPNA
jgi:hypothetical protein